MQPDGCISIEPTRQITGGRGVPGASRPEPPDPARQPEQAGRADSGRAVGRAGHDQAVGQQAPGRPGSGQPGHDRVARPGETALPQRRAHQRHCRPVDQPVRPRTGPGARGPQNSPGGQPDGYPQLRLRDLHQHHAGTTMEGPDRADVHPTLLGDQLYHRLGQGIPHDLGQPRGPGQRPRTSRDRLRPVPPSVLHLAQLHPGTSRAIRLERGVPRQHRRRAPVHCDLRDRAGRRRRGQADRHS